MAEIGFWLHPRARGAGRAVAAVDLAARFARRCGLTRLTARTVTDNAASRHTLLRAGFGETGRERTVAPSGAEFIGVFHQREL